MTIVVVGLSARTLRRMPLVKMFKHEHVYHSVPAKVYASLREIHEMLLTAIVRLANFRCFLELAGLFSRSSQGSE